MLFNSFAFAGFFLLVFAVYVRMGHRFRTLWLLAASYAFYAVWDARFLGLIILSTAVDFLAGLRIASASSPSQRNRWLLASVGTNLGLLGTFKYFDFFAENLAALLAALGLPVTSFELGLVLPVGISFYTFQSMSYCLDIHRGKLLPTRNPIDFALFVAFFPQLLAGPIERGHQLLPQIQQPRRVDWQSLSRGAHLIFIGLIQKVFVADNLGQVADTVFGSTRFGAAEVIIGTWAFMLQVFCDFAGYSNMARGLAQLLGFELSVNFFAPLTRANVTAAWSSWHMTLAAWFRDYVLHPLIRGRRLGASAALLVTWGLIGLWHGAAWNFVFFGLFTGATLVAHRHLRGRLALPGPEPLQLAIGWLITIHLTLASAFLFRIDTWDRGLSMLTALFTAAPSGAESGWLLVQLLFFGLPAMLLQWGQTARHNVVWLLDAPLWQRVSAYVVGFYLLLWFGQMGGREFVYYQF